LILVSQHFSIFHTTTSWQIISCQVTDKNAIMFFFNALPYDTCFLLNRMVLNPLK